MTRTFNIAVSNFTDCGRLLKPNGEDANLEGILIDTIDGESQVIMGFDYVSQLFEQDVVLCSCGKQLDPHQIALYTSGREHILVPARCCKKFRWYKGDAND